jgi:uncharacterized protein (TIGR03437 family)
MRVYSIFTFLLSALAQANDLSLSPVSLSKESSGSMTLRFTPSPEPVVAFQFDLDYDPSAIRLTAFAGEAARLAGKTLYTAQLSPSRVRYLLTGWNQTAILEGPLVRFLVGSTPQAALRESTVTLSNLATTYPNGFSAPLTASGASITVIPGAPVRLVEAGILNAAAFSSGPLAPGEITTLLGTGIGPTAGTSPDRSTSSTVLGGTSVWFDGVPAQLLYADPGQINLVAPFGLTGRTTELVVRNGSLITASVRVPVAAVAPGVFTLSANGTGPAAVLNQNATVNSASNPAARGQIVSIFATGAGAMDPPGRDGALGQGTGQRPILPVSVKIGGIEAEILYAGSPPGLIAGALQVNCRVPANSPTGAAVEVELTVGGVSSGPGTTLSVER